LPGHAAEVGTARAPDRRTDTRQENVAYRTFWDHVGAEFPDLGGAASTTFYRENEKRLISRHLRTLVGQRVLKTDLWDEARNTRILQWVQRQGAEVVGVDISVPVVRLARAEFAGAPLTAANADVRALPFSDARFDAVYSMGTIEHFPETERAVRELYRVLKPGGRAIVGVPNRHDPFLRPLMVAILYRLGLYGYGYEKSYSRKTLRQMLEAAGFVVTGDDGILFIPGWLRMLDLLCHTRYPFAARLTAAGVRVFGWIDAHVPAVRRYGYLVVAIGERPAEAARARSG
jgi:SAM-dependent methyltransferase